MAYFLRASVALGLGIFLLAAGQAPELDFPRFDAENITVEVPRYGLSAHSLFLEDPVAEPYGAEAMASEAPESVTPVAEIVVPDNVPVAPDASGIDLSDAATLSEAVYQVRNGPAFDMDDEMRCLAIAVYFESKGEPLAGQLAVAQVILNRVKAGRFGNSICGVVKAPKQFSFVRNGNLGEPRHAPSFRTAKAIAWIASNDAWDLVVGRATHFHATRVNPAWKLQRVATIGNHIFYQR